MVKYPDYFKLAEDELFLISQKALIVKDNKILLVKIKAKYKGWHNKWGLPGGLIEMWENPEDGLKREIKEELGASIKIIKPIATGTYRYDKFILQNGKIYKVQFIGIAYSCKLQNKKIKLSKEHNTYEWFSKSEIKNIKISPDSQFAINFFFKE